MMNGTLTEDELKELKHKALDVLSHSRHMLLSKYPFIGSIALSMDLIPVRDIRVRTACTDGNSVYFDIAFLSSLSQDEQVFVLAHEVWHAVLLHLTRRGTRNHELFNVATDKEVNYLLKEDGFVPPSNLCFPDKNEEGKSAEEIYELMLKKMKQQLKSSSSKSGHSGKSNGNSSSSNSSTGKNAHSMNGSSSSTGKSANGMSGQFDKHIYEGEEADQPNKNENQMSEEIHDKYGKVGMDADFKPSIDKNFADRMRETVISTAQRVEKMKGDVPSHIKELVKKIMTPEIKWQEVLAQFVTKCYNSGNRSWIPPNRRHIHNDIYLQSMQANKIRLACIIDTSGSTYNDRGKFLTELNSLIKSFGVFDLTILDVDAEVNDVRHFTQDDDIEHIIENSEFTFSGGGGTCMLPGFNRIIDDGIECDAIICLTDGYIDDIPTNPTGLPTLWVITKDGVENFCDWGQKIKLKNESYNE